MNLPTQVKYTEITISTIALAAGFETAVSHPLFNQGDLIIVDHSATRKEALRAHAHYAEALCGVDKSMGAISDVDGNSHTKRRD